MFIPQRLRRSWKEKGCFLMITRGQRAPWLRVLYLLACRRHNHDILLAELSSPKFTKAKRFMAGYPCRNSETRQQLPRQFPLDMGQRFS